MSNPSALDLLINEVSTNGLLDTAKKLGHRSTKDIERWINQAMVPMTKESMITIILSRKTSK